MGCGETVRCGEFYGSCQGLESLSQLTSLGPPPLNAVLGAQRLRELLADVAKPEEKVLRLTVEAGGCSGFSYRSTALWAARTPCIGRRLLACGGQLT